MTDIATPWRPRGPQDATFEVLLVGCGLIGGSIARATRRHWPAVRVVGVDRPRVLETAKRRRILHRGLSLKAAYKRIEAEPPELVVLALPVDGIVDVLPAIAGACKRSPRPPLVIDVGSVKAPIVELAHSVECPRFIGGHPMAGTEQGGVESCSASLFDARTFVLCPAATTSDSDRSKVQRWVRGLGATPRLLPASEHDRIVALTSHLPHVAAWTLMDVAMREAAKFSQRGLPWDLAAGSWRDATRVAAADTSLWTSILQHNRDAIASVLDEWITTLVRVRNGLLDGSSSVLEGGPQGVDATAIARQRRKIRAKLPPVGPGRG